MTGSEGKKSRRVCVFGGSFDPVHLAHIHMAEEALRQFALDEVLFMPTGVSYHKGHASASAEDRNAIILLAIEGREGMSLSTLDQSRDGSTYTADTLTILQKQAPENEYFFLLGADSLMHIQNWERPEVIFDTATIIAVYRPGTDNTACEEHAEYLKKSFGARIVFMTHVFDDISSSHIRDVIWRCSRTHDEDVFEELSGLVTQKAAEYIVSHGLYTDEDPWTDEEIIADLKERLDEKRFEHTLGVAQTAEKLAECWGEDRARAYKAGLLHDCAKFLKGQEYINRAQMADIELSDTEIANPGLIHAKLGAYYARERYNITDDNIVMAIRSHTTGRPEMSLLEEIIYVSDYIEPHRDVARHLDIYRKTAFEDLQKTVMMIAGDTLAYLQEKGAPVDPATEETYRWYQSRFSGDETRKDHMEEKNTSLEMAKIAVQAIDSKRGQEITVIEISGMSSLGDYFVIAHGKNARQVQTMADETEAKLAEAGYRPGHIEGYTNAGWILMDYGDIVVHIFSEDERRFYDLERIWKEGRFLSPEELGIEAQGQGQD